MAARRHGFLSDRHTAETNMKNKSESLLLTGAGLMLSGGLLNDLTNLTATSLIVLLFGVVICFVTIASA